jgi:signal transduction histidine kinase
MVDALESEQTRRLSNERFAAIGKMAAHVTHEIRNPLNSISLNLELLEDEEAPEDDKRELLRAVRREVERLEGLSEEYLRLARLPSPRKEAGDVEALVRRVVEFEKRDLVRTDVTVDIRTSGVIPQVAFDEGQLRQALVNLLRNAREAMPSGGAVEVTLETRALDVSLEVADRGGGIPADIQPRVFDPFFSTKGEGTGLGLSITKQIVESHDGTITYRSRPGGGSIFAITLPLAVIGADRK